MSDVDTNSNLSDAQIVPGSTSPDAASQAPASAPGLTEPPKEAPSGTSPPPDEGEAQKAREAKAFQILQRQRGAAERRAMRAEARLEALEKGQQPPPKPQSTELRPEDFPNYDAYAKALARQEARAAAKEEIEADKTTRSQNEAQQAAKRQHDTFLREATKQAAAAGIDFESAWETLAEAPLVSPAVASFVYESENPAALVEYLAENLDELDRVSRLGPAAAFRALVKAEAALPPAKLKPNATNAPPPPPKVGGRSVTQTDWRKSENMDDYGANWHRDREARLKD